AKDKATGKEQSIIIKSSGGLSEEEINKMIQDAETNKEEDKKFEELVQTRNQADGMIHTIRKTLKEIKNEDEKNKLESLINNLEQTLKSDDIKTIKEDLNKLTEEYSTIYQKIYSEKKPQNHNS
ncbi:Hsp70 family protein, partial [Bacillus anthracis]|nr:Hsp70 family protein [Bacillus anthracis]